MIFLRNKGTQTTPISLSVGTTILPFDTLVCNTNSATAWNPTNNSITMGAQGRYNANCTVDVISGTSDSTVTLALLANGTAITGDSVSATIPGSYALPLSLDVPVNVETTSGSDSYLQWAVTVTSAATISNAFASVQRIQ